jgi:hypothetical protein
MIGVSRRPPFAKHLTADCCGIQGGSGERRRRQQQQQQQQQQQVFTL